MTPRITLAVAGRVLTQIRRDRRTLALLLVVPCALISLLWWMFQGQAPGPSTCSTASAPASWRCSPSS